MSSQSFFYCFRNSDAHKLSADLFYGRKLMLLRIPIDFLAAHKNDLKLRCELMNYEKNNAL